MHRAGGVVAFLSGRINGRVFISVLAYLPGRHNSTELLRQTVADALTAFSLKSGAGLSIDAFTHDGVRAVTIQYPGSLYRTGQQ